MKKKKVVTGNRPKVKKKHTKEALFKSFTLTSLSLSLFSSDYDSFIDKNICVFKPRYLSFVDRKQKGFC